LLITSFDPPELVARVRAALRRARQLRDVSPLTGLPGNSEITRQVERLVRDHQPFALIHADLDHFKSYNDRYGFLRGDAAIKATAEVLEEALDGYEGETCFLGHVGGDDFVLLTEPDVAEDLARSIISRFDAMAPSLYDADDAARGWIEIDDRRNNRRQVEIMTISLGIATTQHRPLLTSAEAATIATEMKMAAKVEPESAYRIDQRRS
jgi:diguanylate cyclase (GGDEF)-like protein